MPIHDDAHERSGTDARELPRPATDDDLEEPRSRPGTPAPAWVRPLPADGAASPAGHGPPAESGAAPGTSVTSAPGEATGEIAETAGLGTPTDPRQGDRGPSPTS